MLEELVAGSESQMHQRLALAVVLDDIRGADRFDHRLQAWIEIRHRDLDRRR